ncbi:response regulator [Phenylobacterium hankyongense]|uniref:response regulator n=1 Tax=Phenylobacterium hankyongense TaxID=1813876 RepID=UPI001401F129|nr:response regulator [Phenylobacterium hankyongense]
MLVVDDVPDNRAILARRFMRLGYEVTEAEDGAEALELIAQYEYDIVLLDIMMPKIDGLEVLKRVRETRSQAELPIIMVSAKASSEDVVDALLLGANDYVTKPVDLKVAHARVEAQLARKRAEDLSRAAHGELEIALSALRGRVVEAEGDADDARPNLDRALDVASVVTRICESPTLHDTVELIDAAVATLHRLSTTRPAPTATASRPEPTAGRVRILSADGAAHDRQVVRLMLAEAEAGIELVEVSDGAEAAAAAAAGRFDLIILGLQMPGMDGLAAIGEIRAQELRSRHDRTPILAVSAHADSAALAIKAGADLHLAKPVTAAALLNAVVRALSQGPEKLASQVA